MTVSTEVNHNEYTGNGVTTTFPYAFRIFQASDLLVTTSDSDGVLRTLVLNTDYTVSGVGAYYGGHIVLNKPLSTGWRISIERSLAVVQETDLRNQGRFFAETHESAFDYLTMIIQQCFAWTRLALKKPNILAKYYDAKNNRISNLANGNSRNDAVNKGYVDDLFNGGVTPPPYSAKNDIFTNHQRKIVATMPLLFPDHDAIMATNPSATYMYPQAFCVSEDLIYITYPFEPKQPNNVVAVFNISGIYQGYFYVQAGGPGFAAEGVVVTSDYGPKKMFVGHTNGILREFNLEGASYGSNLPLVQNHEVGLFNQFSYRKGIWLVEQNSPEIGQTITRTVLAMFDSNFNRLSTITLPLHDVGYVTESTSPYAPYFNKRQGIAVGDNYFVCGYGGFITDGAASAGYNEYQGSKVFNPDGTKRTESMLHPQAMMDLMKAAGLNVTRIENEGVCLSEDGKSIYSLYIHQERTGTEPYNSGLVIFEEYSTDKNSIDFSSASRMYRGFDVDHASIGLFPRSAQGIVNPVDGTLFTNMTQILRYMQEMSQKAFNFFTGTVSITDISGALIPASTYVEILNANNQTFIVNYYSSDSGISYLVATNTSGDFVFVRQRPAQWASNLTIQQNADPNTNQLNRITASSYAGATTNSQKILVLDQQATASANGLVLGGSSSVFRSATTVDIACNSDPTALGGTIRWRFYDTGLRPFADNTYNFGQASFRIKDAYFANAPTVSSDATLKTNPEAISDLSEMLSSDKDSILDAWGDISVVAYRWLDAISMKGEGARWHFGVIAQQVRDVFQAHGIDGTRFGLLCYDEWDDIFEPVMATEEIVDSSGELVTVEYDTGEKKLVKKAGSSWGIRPDQCAWIEAAYQRRRCDRIEERIQKLEEK